MIRKKLNINARFLLKNFDKFYPILLIRKLSAKKFPNQIDIFKILHFEEKKIYHPS